MKKILTTAGFAALGVAGLHAAYAPGLTPMETSKPWSVAATLRGFYDDNYATRNSHLVNPATGEKLKRDSFGIEFSPSFGLNLVLQQTYINLSYIYGLKWYEDRETDTVDQSHQFNARLSHAFSDRFKIDLSDSFVIAQEPAVLEPSGATSIPLRSEGDNMRNTAEAKFTAELTRQIGVMASYGNNLYDYDEEGPGTRSAVLDRMEHMITVNLLWNVRPTTVGVLGYQYQIVDYTSDDSLDGTPGSAFVDPSIRNNRTHYIYVGADHTFNPALMGSVRLGGTFRDYNNATGNMDDSTAAPYADASLTWTYNPGSQLQVGIRHAYNATDVAFVGGTEPTMDQESTTVYASVTHRITAKLTGKLLGQAQFSEFQGGFADGSNDNYFLLGANLSYQLNPWLAAEAGYNFDRLDSDLDGRSFSRNRVYIGVRAAY
jgi:hypothetical protein